MGQPTEMYQEQTIEVLTPEVHVQVEGGDPYLLWTAGVIVPIVLALIPYIIKRWRNDHPVQNKEKHYAPEPNPPYITREKEKEK